MATVYLHIGLPKTGTTAIQHFLRDNTTALEKHGICYPDFGLDYSNVSPYRNGHFLVPYFKEEDLSIYESSLNQLEEISNRFEKIILSDEALWRFGEQRPEAWEKLLDDLKKRGLKLHIIVYLRRQDRFLLSYYRQRVKGAHTDLSFYDCLDELQEMYPLDYYAYLNMLSGTIGRECLSVRIYEKEQFQGTARNLYSDFLSVFDLPLEEEFTTPNETLNETFDDTNLELRRILNTLPEAFRDDPILGTAFKRNARNGIFIASDEKTSFFRPGEQAAYLESFAETNRRLAREYLGREDGVLFYDNSGTDLPEYRIHTEELLQETIRFYARAIRLLEIEMNRIKRKQNAEERERKENALFPRLKRMIRHIRTQNTQSES